MYKRQSGDEILRKKCREVKEVTDRVRMILDDMVETMYHADGGGLAANQVGILKRLVVIDVGEGLFKLVDPEFVLQEGCLLYTSSIRRQSARSQRAAF